MLLTISTTYQPATDLGYLLHKNPGRLQSFKLPFGRADVFYPEADRHRCTVALLLNVDPVGLVRPKSGAPSPTSNTQSFPFAGRMLMEAASTKSFGSRLMPLSTASAISRPCHWAGILPALAQC